MGTTSRGGPSPLVRWAAVAAAVAVLLGACGGGAEPAEVALGEGDAVLGEQRFARSCIGCHGEAATGTLRGPPLVHEVYEPSHHPDEAFLRAVRDGVPAHHWDFGPMPPIGGVSDEDVAHIVAYVRQLQRDAGIE